MPSRFRGPSAGRCSSIAIVCFLASPAIGQGYWRPAPASPTVPADRVGASLVFDESAGVALLYGGGHNLLHEEVWSWNGAAWQLLDVSPAPGPRTFHVMSYDPLRQRSYMFGGDGGLGAGDMWEWHTATRVWTQLLPTTMPLTRSAAAMVYDASRRVHVLFGGERGNVKLDETWEWDGSDWTQRSLPVAPLGRSWHAMAYDTRRQRVVLFGGQEASNGPLGDLWEYDGATWVQRTQGHAPVARVAHAMVYDAPRGVVVLWGGEAYPLTYGTPDYPETWEWDGSQWSEVASVTEPDRAAGCALAFDVVRGEAVLFGGHPANQVSVPRMLLYSSAGMSYCGARPNSTGLPATIGTSGSPIVANDDLALWASELPPFAFGVFLTSPTPGFLPLPGGSQGDLCLAGAIGRFSGPGQVQSSGAQGALALEVALDRVPTPNGFVAVVAGDTRHFQAWYRDSVQGVATSNFTHGVTVQFR
jgi:hypothetical protein